ncbi:Uncharacterised protein [Mycobacteroides abscessus subsp. abscessus]|uniref:hypothetical protein n=1 Tax=Mycobacteroides abscessus TaxID=36809 RepID=UPI00092C62AA|nr:hypothetical protein [Mycobacteroides abscessus]SHU70323.1 Uncharacterised protein [Mycobacteroides abscessus subsp. abscessus]
MSSSEFTPADREQLLSEARQWISLGSADGDAQNAGYLRRLVQALEAETARADHYQAEVERLQSRLRPSASMPPPMMGPPSMGPPMMRTTGAPVAGPAAAPFVGGPMVAGSFGPVAPSAGVGAGPHVTGSGMAMNTGPLSPLHRISSSGPAAAVPHQAPQSNPSGQPGSGSGAGSSPISPNPFMAGPPLFSPPPVAAPQQPPEPSAEDTGKDHG